MTVTLLAILFLLIILFVAVVGYKTITQRVTTLEQNTTEQCSICLRSFDKSQLVERQIKDYKVYRFCRSCVEELHQKFSSLPR